MCGDMDTEVTSDLTEWYHYETEDFQTFPSYRLTPPRGWATLPQLLLEEIYHMLPYKTRHLCSQVCLNWYWVFYSPCLWKNLVVGPTSFTYRRLNRYTGEEKEVSKYKVHMCLQQVGRYFQRITILPNANFHNMSKVMQSLGRFLNELSADFPLQSLRRFDFDFSCESKDLWSHDFIIVGTGGGLLRDMNNVLKHLRNIEHLSFNNLCLKSQDAVGFLDEFVINNRETLRYLEIKNCTRHRYPLINAGLFPHITTLVTSPLHISDSVLMLLAEKTTLQTLVLVQDRYTGACEAVNAHVWSDVKFVAPHLNVRLELNGRTAEEVLIQPMAPVNQIVYHCPNAQVNTHMIVQYADEYKTHLQVFGHKGIQRKYRSRRFHERADSTLVLLVRECPLIHTLVISERVSTATLLIIATELKRLSKFYVRRNAVLLKSDWPKAVCWTDAYNTWLQSTARSYDLVEREISRILGYRWVMLSDRAFKEIKV